MSLARIVRKGRTYAVTRRCLQQRWFLRPSPQVNSIVRFLLARYAKRWGIKLHAWTFMSNHFHLVLTDPAGMLPRFMSELCSMLSRTLNKVLGRSDRLWESRPYTAEEIKDETDLVFKLAYVACNPVAARVVKNPHHWPGVIGIPSAKTLGVEQVVEQPSEGLWASAAGTRASPSRRSSSSRFRRTGRATPRSSSRTSSTPSRAS